MHTHPSPSAHVCTPPQRARKPRSHAPVAAGGGSAQLTSAAPRRDHHAEWAALTFAQQEVQARDQLVAMLDRAAWNSPEFQALSYAAAVLTINIENRRKTQGGAA